SPHIVFWHLDGRIPERDVKKQLRKHPECAFILISKSIAPATLARYYEWGAFDVFTTTELSIPALAKSMVRYVHRKAPRTELKVTEETRLLNEKDFYLQMNASVNNQDSFRKRYDAVLRALLDYTQFDIAEGWISSIDHKKLILEVSHHNDTESAKNFIRINKFKGTTLGHGLPGMAWNSGQLEIWDTIANCKNFTRIYEAKRAKIQFAVAIPIFHLGRIQGVIQLMREESPENLPYLRRFLIEFAERFGGALHRLKQEHETGSYLKLVPDMLCILSEKGIISKVNPAFSQVSGHSRLKLLGTPIQNLVHPDDVKATRSLLVKAKRSKTPVSFQNRLLRPNGELLYIDWSLAYDTHQGVLHAIAKDVTRERELEQFLDEANRLIGMAHWDLDVATGAVRWSSQLYDILGVPKDFQPTLENSMDFYTEEGKALINEELERVLSGTKTQFDITVQAITRTKELRWVRLAGQARYHKGTCIKLFGIFQNVQEQYTATQKIVSYHQRYKLAVDAASIGVWELDLKSGEIFWDDLTFTLFHYPKPDNGTLWGAWKERVHPEDYPRVTSEIRDAITKEEKHIASFRILLPDGSQRWLKGRLDLIRNDDRVPVKLIGVVYDVTEEINHKQALSEAAANKEAILTNISDGFFALSESGEITYWNRAAENIFDIEERDALRRSLWEAVPELTNTQFKARLSESTRASETIIVSEYLPTI
ncbi:PAS domain-containing protein, partial [Altibacter sp.]|uniref:PAS domain-containing protein n=1 Tax=Altibacter sp. TaxID=2024823 RepID=UPI00258B3407